MVNIEKFIQHPEEIKKESREASFSSSGQKNRDDRLEASVKKELKENSLYKANMTEFLIDRLVGKLSLPENYRIIDEAIGENGATQELAEKIWRYTEKLGTKNIHSDSSAKDILRNLETTLLGFVNLAKKKGVENWKEEIQEDFGKLENYFDFLMKYPEFEKQELGTELGFLSGKIEKEKLKKLRKSENYIKECESILDAKQNKRVV